MVKLALVKDPVPQELTDFLGGFPGEHLFATKPAKTGMVYSYGTIQDNYKRLKEANNLGHKVYFIPNYSNGNGAEIQDITASRATFIDDDIPRSEPRTDFMIDPSCIVETSKGKYHYYWWTSTNDLDAWRSVQNALINMYGTDSVIHNPNRLMRLPCFMHESNFESRYIPKTLKIHDFTTLQRTWPSIDTAIPQRLPEAESSTMDEMVKTIAEGISDTGLHKATRNYAYGQIEDGVKPATVKANLRTIMRDYDPSNARQMENLGKVDDLVDSQYTKYFKKKYDTPTPFKTLIPDALSWDWSILKSNPIPEESIPDSLLSAAKEIGEWAATGQDPAILSAIFITSALLNKNVQIHEIGDDLVTNCQSGIVIVMDTGGRKSSIYKQMNEPFFEYEEIVKKEWEEERFIYQAEYEDIRSQIKSLETKAKKMDTAEKKAFYIKKGLLLSDLDKLESKLREPRLRASDVTEEKLSRLLYANEGVMAIISDDARPIIKNIKGRYTKDSTGESIYVNGLTGSDIMNDRVGTNGTSTEYVIKSPVLNALLFVQPDAALSLKNSEMYVPSGLAARLPMYFYPISGSKIVRETQRRPVNQDKMQRYYQSLRNICHNRRDNPLHIRITENGMKTCKDIDNKFADLLEDSWRGHYDKVNKLVTLTLMYATVFAAIDDPMFSVSYTDSNAQKGMENEYILSSKYINMAFMFSKSLFTQAISSHEQLHYESIPRKAESFLSTLKKWYAKGKITEGFVNQGDFRNSVSTAYREDLSSILDLLVEKNWLFVKRFPEQRRKLNGGFPNKLVDTGDFVFHLNINGIKERELMGLDDLEGSLRNEI